MEERPQLEKQSKHEGIMYTHVQCRVCTCISVHVQTILPSSSMIISSFVYKSSVPSLGIVALHCLVLMTEFPFCLKMSMQVDPFIAL